MPHRHRAIPPQSEDRGYTGPVAPPGRENPAAHGNICRTDYCRCGATRKTLINGCHIERGAWIEPDEGAED